MTKRSCPDDGGCHHACVGSECFRVQFCGPLSNVYPDDEWPDIVLRSHPAPRGTIEEVIVR